MFSQRLDRVNDINVRAFLNFSYNVKLHCHDIVEFLELLSGEGEIRVINQKFY